MTYDEDVYKLMDLITKGDNLEVVRHLESKQIEPEYCLEVFRIIPWMREPKYHGVVQWAVECGRVDIINTLIAHGFSPREVTLGDETGTQPIHLAALRGKVDVIKCLVEDHGVSPGQTDIELNTPMFYAFLDPERTNYFAVKYLLEKGADANVLNQDLESGGLNNFNPLTQCVTFELPPEFIHLLISHGADVNVSYALNTAARWNRLHIMEILLDAGADIEVTDHGGDTPLIEAASNNQLLAASYLHYKGANLAHQNKDGDSALHLALKEGHYHIVKLLVVDCGAPVGLKNREMKTPLIIAVEEVNRNIVLLLLRTGYRPSPEELSFFDSDNPTLRKEGMNELLLDLKDSACTPWTLQDCCIFKLRGCLGKKVDTAVNSLPIPGKMKDMIILNYL